MSTEQAVVGVFEDGSCWCFEPTDEFVFLSPEDRLIMVRSTG